MDEEISFRELVSRKTAEYFQKTDEAGTEPTLADFAAFLTAE